MGIKSKIEWTDATWNPWYCCRECSPGCENCYARDWARRAGRPWGKPVQAAERTFFSPLRWKEAKRIFTCSLSDFFFDGPGVNDWRSAAWDIIRQGDHHLYLILTKRVENVLRFLPSDWHGGWPQVRLGVTICNIDEIWKADALRSIPAAGRFISYEPLLGQIPDCNFAGYEQIMVEGESLPGGRAGRPYKEDWVRELRDAAIAQGVAFFYKQGHKDGRIVSMPELDGKVWDEIAPSTDTHNGKDSNHVSNRQAH